MKKIGDSGAEYQVLKDVETIATDIETKVNEIENHFHNTELWLGNGAVEDSLTGYQLTSGNNLFGSEVLLLDTGDTPVRAGNTIFAIHRMFITALSSGTPYYIRFIYGTGTVGDAETAKQYTTIPITSCGVGVNTKGSPAGLIFPRLAVGTKVWAKCKNASNLATISGLIGIHEYVE